MNLLVWQAALQQAQGPQAQQAQGPQARQAQGPQARQTQGPQARHRLRDRFNMVFIPGAFPELVEGRTQKGFRITPILLLLYLQLLEAIPLNEHSILNHQLTS